ncbi:MAG: hypothetical protein WCG67_01805 [Ferruginibacter sp.]
MWETEYCLLLAFDLKYLNQQVYDNAVKKFSEEKRDVEWINKNNSKIII